jgi:hypothetical protein
MSEFFWETTQKARGSYFCDWCCQWIQPGETYLRRIWRPRRGSFIVWREHTKPACDMPEPPGHLRERMFAEERVTIGLALEARQKVVLRRNGGSEIVTELVCTPVATPASSESAEYDDVEIPF